MKKIIAGIAIAGGLTLASAGAASASAASAPGHEYPNPNKAENCSKVVERQDSNGQTRSDDDLGVSDIAVTNCDGLWTFLRNYD